MRFSNRVAIVTGAGSGIGEATVRRYATEGAAVVVIDLEAERAHRVAGEIESGGGRAIAIAADVSNVEQAAEAIAKTLGTFGRLDILVNNAAITTGDDLLQIDEATWDRDVDGVLKSVYACTRPALRHMVERRAGVVINIAAVNAFLALGNEPYSAAKAGVAHLTKSIAVRYGAHGIRANAVAPGTTRTPPWRRRLERDPSLMDRLVRWYPLGRIGEPEDIASAVLFLSSEEASWITGVVLNVDGGLLAGNGLLKQDLFS